MTVDRRELVSDVRDVPGTLLGMFTGIVEEKGVVVAAEVVGNGKRLTIRAPLATTDLSVGDSIAVDGACLTAVSVDEEASTFDVEIVRETVTRTTLGGAVPGTGVNLERAMPASGRFDGHIVQGHVDGVGIVAGVEPEGLGSRIALDVAPELLRYIVEKGSLTVDGVSLTVAGVIGDRIEIALIPLTLEVTTLGSKAVADGVNLEVDILAKYVERLMETRT